MEVEFRVGERVAKLDVARHTKEQIVKLLEGLVQNYIAAHCPRTTQTRNAASQSNRGVWAPTKKVIVNESMNIGRGLFTNYLVENFNPFGSGNPPDDEQDYRKPVWQGGLGERGLDGLFPLVKPPLPEDSVKFESFLAAVNSLRHIGAEPWDLEIQNNPNFQKAISAPNNPSAAPVAADDSIVRLLNEGRFDYNQSWLPGQKQIQSQSPYIWDTKRRQLVNNPEYWREIQEPIFDVNWKDKIRSFRQLTTVAEDSIPPMQSAIDYMHGSDSKFGEWAGTVRSEVMPAMGMLSDQSIQSAIAFDGFGESMEGTGLKSSVLAEVLPDDAMAMGDGVYRGLEPAKVGFNELTGGMSDLLDLALRMPEVGQYLSSVLCGSLRRGGTPAARSDGTDSDGENPGQEPDPVSYDEALDHYQQTSGETAENIAWMRANPDKEIDSGPNKGWTFTKLMRDHVNKGGGNPGFAMGGVVPGPIGAPVPALLHGGERVLRSGQAGGGPVDVCLHVHGAVLSERELVRSVREGLIRLNREVTEMGF